MRKAGSHPAPAFREKDHQAKGDHAVKTLQTVLRLHQSRLELNRATRGHVAAFKNPKGVEKPLVHLIQFIAEYADAYRRETGGRIGSGVGVESESWRQVYAAAGQLLVGNCGRLDCDEMFTLLSELGKAAGLA
jgi:hypothetical protein